MRAVVIIGQHHDDPDRIKWAMTVAWVTVMDSSKTRYMLSPDSVAIAGDILRRVAEE